MKGRTNYLCLHRFERLQEARGRAAASTSGAGSSAWRSGPRVTETGDRAEIEDLPDDLPLWTELAATSEQCLGRECPQLRRLLRHAHARARRRGRRRHRQPSPALRGRVGAPGRVRRSHSRVRPRRHRRSASARGRRHAVLRRRAQHVPRRRVRARCGAGGRRAAGRAPTLAVAIASATPSDVAAGRAAAVRRWRGSSCARRGGERSRRR